MNKMFFGFLAVFIILFGGCGRTVPEAVSHADSATVAIDASNALSIAADVYRVAAIDVPFTASESMDSAGNINAAACTNANAISGSMGMMQAGMTMVFTDCQLQNANGSGHTLIVNGECNNTADSVSSLVETVIGDEIAFSISAVNSGANHTLVLHGFSVTRDSDNLTRASGTLHLANEDIVMFSTVADFGGTAQAPTAGRLVIFGANNTTIRLTVLAGGLFDMDIDLNGDGDYADVNEALYNAENWSTTFWAVIP